MNKCLLLVLSLDGCLSAPATEQPHVFAHYMVCFNGREGFTGREIKLAQRYGIDGFALNCGEWKYYDRSGAIKDSGYVESADRIYQTAKDTAPDFRLFFSPDFAGQMIKKEADLNLGDMIRRYYDHPNQFRHDGKSFLSGYSGMLLDYDSPVRKLKAEGYKLTVVPLPSPITPMTWSFENVLKFFPQDGPFDGLFRFVCDGTVPDLIDVNATARRATMYLGKLYMAGVSPAYNSANLRDFKGMQGYASMWEGIIRDRPDFVEIVTWNDYNEDSNLMPYRAKPPGEKLAIEKRFYDRDESYLDATAYFSAWYKTKRQPEITQDKLYFTYRRRSRDLRPVWDEKHKKWEDVRFDPRHFDQMHDDVRDAVYVTAFLTADADLEIIQGAQISRVSMKKGIAYAEAPMNPGHTPRFRLLRKDAPVIDVSGRREIVDKPTEANSLQAGSLVNRIWTSGAVAGLAARSYPLGDQTMKPGVPALVVPAKSLGNQSYNFRLTYRNPSSTEARLTLYADGGPGAEGSYANCFPLDLPSTGNEFRTISFIWSAWADNTKFTISCDHSDDPQKANLDFNDFGEVELRSLELIANQVTQSKPVELPKHPELLKIPGGDFLMGGAGGSPDELPAHKVRLTGFAIGKYEVTNAELERLVPDHREMRDAYSWRDDEPALYVSWVTAARYCNLLSVKNGLAPAYDEKTWKLDKDADGFRLPTEAEWEYVATGRGENRTYPWGGQPPGPGLGNFQPGGGLDCDPGRNASVQRGVRVVGDYPRGASRDGVMDMAGNVSEWCADTYADYQSGDAVDPLCEQPSPYRVIRGGSWGYYNQSQRCRDREYNNPGYGGYIYLGFRIAIGRAGLEKLGR